MADFDPVSYMMGQKAAPGGGSSTLSGLTDVDITNPTDGQMLVYNAATGKWENGAGGGYKVFEVTFIAVEYGYPFSYSGALITSDGVTVYGGRFDVYVGTPVTLKLLSFSDSLIIPVYQFDVDTSYMPVCTGEVELDLAFLGFMTSGDGTITCKGLRTD